MRFKINVKKKIKKYLKQFKYKYIMRKKANIKNKSLKKSCILQKNDEMMKMFKNKDSRLNEINIEINKINKEIQILKRNNCLNNINNSLKSDTLFQNKSKIDKLEETIKKHLEKKNDIELNNDQNKYILDTCEILDKYLILDEQENELLSKDDPDVEKILSKINMEKRILEESYFTRVDPNYTPNRNLNKINSTFCQNCNDILHIEHGSAVCYNCGSCFECLHLPEDLSYKEQQEMDYRHQFTYEKESHLIDWINRFQAKENKEISQEILDKVIIEAHKAKIHDLNKLEEKHVKAFLKKLKLNDYYDNVIAIINRINKRPPFVLTPQIENKIKEMFRKMQEPFNKFKGARKNMLSYGYLLNKFFLILDLPEFAKYIKLLKSQEKLRQQDEIFKKIVDHMVDIDPGTNWKFHPSL
jgi:hypothetical protein